MKRILLFVLPLALIVVPSVCYQNLWLNLKKKKKEKIHLLWTYIMMIYLWFVFSVAGIGSIWDIIDNGGIINTINGANINLIPFQSEGVFTYGMNIIMFMPLGFLIPFIWRNYRKLLKIVLVAGGLSVFIEFAQIPTNRITDIDDLIMNTLGAAFGYLIWKIYYGVFKVERDSVTLSAHEPEVYLILSLLGQFLLYNWRIFQY